jgi:hypothetical protein
MAQVFSPAADTYLRFLLLALAIVLVGGALVGGGLVRSDYLSRRGIAPEQPVPFSHRHHAGQLGIDCRYCHYQVERAASAGYPPTHTCMSCHSQLWTHADALATVRESLATGTPIRWNRVHDLPDFVYSPPVAGATWRTRRSTRPMRRPRSSLMAARCRSQFSGRSPATIPGFGRRCVRARR